MKTRLSDWWIDEEGYPVLDVADPSIMMSGGTMETEFLEGDDLEKAKAIAEALNKKGHFKVRFRRH